MSVEIAETWPNIFSRLDLKPLRRNRGQCPLCESGTGFSTTENKTGLFYCFSCNAAGDKINFIELLLGCNFKAALAFFGLDPSRPPKPDPAIARRRAAERELELRARQVGRELRNEFYLRSRVKQFGLRRLRRNSEDALGWELLALAYRGIPLIELEGWLDRIDIGRPEEMTRALEVLK
jgi:hypothetical protein